MSVEFADYQKGGRVKQARFILGGLVNFPFRGGSSWPSGLLRLYSFLDGLRSKLGSITWTGTPTIGADGVAAGAGPSMGTVARGGGKVLALRVKMTKASDGITGDEHVYGPLYFRNGYLVGKLGGQEGVKAHTWAIGDEIAAVVDMTPAGVTVQLVGGLE